uniref:WAP domain-containing protein n=1 Tax=Chelonoidis abingdonii TaxID=106734 RepID=A0A8C0GCR2_CHEAB
ALDPAPSSTMKSGAIFLFLGAALGQYCLIAMCLFCIAVRPGACPIPQGLGTCVEMCQGDNSCPPGWKCCSNGCAMGVATSA